MLLGNLPSTTAIGPTGDPPSTTAIGQAESVAEADQNPVSLSDLQIYTRVSAAASLVAPEFKVKPEVVLSCIPIDVVYNFAFEKRLDLVEVVRDVYFRTHHIQEGLDAVAKESGIRREELSLMFNWFDVYELAQQEGTSLNEMMTRALEWEIERRRQHDRNDEGQPGGNASITKKREFDIFQKQLERAKKLKGIPDGKDSRKESQHNRGKTKKDKMLELIRGMVKK